MWIVKKIHRSGYVGRLRLSGLVPKKGTGVYGFLRRSERSSRFWSNKVKNQINPQCACVGIRTEKASKRTVRHTGTRRWQSCRIGLEYAETDTKKVGSHKSPFARRCQKPIEGRIGKGTHGLDERIVGASSITRQKVSGGSKILFLVIVGAKELDSCLLMGKIRNYKKQWSCCNQSFFPVHI